MNRKDPEYQEFKKEFWKWFDTLRMNNAYVWSSLEEKHGDKVELMSEDTDWLAMDWIIS